MAVDRKRILFGCPAKTGLEAHFIRALVPLLRADIPGFHVDFEMATGGSVASCRNELAHLAVSEGYHALVMADQDLRWDQSDFRALIKHDLPFVAAIYCKKEPGEPYWLFKPWSGEDGAKQLIRCSAMAIGFSLVTVAALEAIRKVTPGQSFHQAWPPSERAVKRHGWFEEVVIDGRKVQEDYFFARQATRAGIMMYADTHIRIPHIGARDYPEFVHDGETFVGDPMKLPAADLFYEQL